MNISQKKIGFALTGSFCTFKKIFPIMKELVDSDCEITPIISNNVSRLSSRFGTPKEFIERIIDITGKTPIDNITKAEPLGPSNILDILLIAPCSGNTLAKLACGITDTPVLMATKCHLRNNKPVVIFLSSNDSLGLNLKNIGILMNTKNIFFVPFSQDNFKTKPNSMVSKQDLIIPTLKAALDSTQLQPVIHQA